jgi:hypothetical protein
MEGMVFMYLLCSEDDARMGHKLIPHGVYHRMNAAIAHAEERCAKIVNEAGPMKWTRVDGIGCVIFENEKGQRISVGAIPVIDKK